MFIQLITGKTICVSAYEYLFLLSDSEVDEFFQACVADDLGDYIENPFGNRVAKGRIEQEEIPEIEELPEQDIDI